MEDEIFELIGCLITVLQDVAIDERHTPRLMALTLTLSPGHLTSFPLARQPAPIACKPS